MRPCKNTNADTTRVGQNPAVAITRITSWRGGESSEREDCVATEEPLEIRVRGRGIAITMRTPGHDAELAAGFLLTEGVIRRREDVVEIAYCQQGEAADLGNTLNVFLAPRVKIDFSSLTRHVFSSSSCGLCGKATIEAAQQHFPPVNSPIKVSTVTLASLQERFRAAQKAFAETGGLHAAALFTARGKLLALREDVGRHNAVDKVIGHAFLKDQPLDRHILMVSGRASFEIMQKALAARIPVVVAVSAPSSLAVEFARSSGQTLVGFLRGKSFNIYAQPGRIVRAR
ncbi:MAG TPA: formate dehydrogenase accessory sulfurtransferase FdhD [Verrucomicrobiae bacterium]|nr:formate dehydrogenase accessory sulfurtransferase FdhD [Verrucomicrobiae bacterium]